MRETTRDGVERISALTAGDYNPAMPLLKAVGKGIGLAIFVPMIVVAVLSSALFHRTGAADVRGSRNRWRRERAAREAEGIDHDENDQQEPPVDNPADVLPPPVRGLTGTTRGREAPNGLSALYPRQQSQVPQMSRSLARGCGPPPRAEG